MLIKRASPLKTIICRLEHPRTGAPGSPRPGEAFCAGCIVQTCLPRPVRLSVVRPNTRNRPLLEIDLGRSVCTNVSLEYATTTYGDDAAAETVVHRRAHKFY